MNAHAKKAHTWARQADNHYVEPVDVSEALFRAERFEGGIVDPCAGWGHVVKAAQGAGYDAYGYDLRDRGGFNVTPGHDFFAPALPGSWPVDNIVSNPPYGRWKDAPEDVTRPDDGLMRMEESFIRLALDRARSKVAVFLLHGWLCADARQDWLAALPLYKVLTVTPRPSCPPGEYLAAGNKAGNGTGDYAWYVFLKGYEGPVTLGRAKR